MLHLGIHRGCLPQKFFHDGVLVTSVVHRRLLNVLELEAGDSAVDLDRTSVGLERHLWRGCVLRASILLHRYALARCDCFKHSLVVLIL